MEHHQEINQEEIMLETMIQGQEELITSKVQEFSKVEVTELQEQQQQQVRQERQVTELDILLKPSLARIQQVIPELSDQNALDLLIAAKLDPEEALRNFFL